MDEINCLNCIHITAEYFDCEKYCGAKNGWREYETIGDETDENIRNNIMFD